MTRRELESGAEARLHDTKTRDLLEQAAAIDWDAKQVPPDVPLTVAQVEDGDAEYQFRRAVRRLVRSRNYDAIRQLLDEELEGVKVAAPTRNHQEVS
jgi:hypothetical protein